MKLEVWWVLGVGNIQITGNPLILVVEVLATLHRLWYCLAEGFRHIELESDTSNVILALNNTNTEGGIFDEIKFLVPIFKVVTWRKVPRDYHHATLFF